MDSPIQELEDDVCHTIQAGGIPMIWGPPGVGKTAMVNGIARKFGLRQFTIVGSLADPTDINGFPVVDEETVADANGVKRKVIKFAPRDFLFRIVNDYGGRGLIFWDELTSVPPAVQASMLKSMLDKQFGDFQLDPHKVAMVAAGNPPEQAANGQELPLPMLNRLAHFHFPAKETAAKEWSQRFTGYWGNPPRVGFDGKYVSENAMTRSRAMVASFISAHPSMWHKIPEGGGTGTQGFCTARSWDRVSHHLGWCYERNSNPATYTRLFQSEVGPDAAMMFVTYLKDTEVPDPETVIANYETFKPSGKVDVDFATMTGVSACVVAHPTAERMTAGWTVAGRIAEARGSDGTPIYEAACVAAMELAKLCDRQKITTLFEEWGKVRDKAWQANFMRKMHGLTKPFHKLKNLMLPTMGE